MAFFFRPRKTKTIKRFNGANLLLYLKGYAAKISFQHILPFRNAIYAARTCLSGRVLGCIEEKSSGHKRLERD